MADRLPQPLHGLAPVVVVVGYIVLLFATFTFLYRFVRPLTRGCAASGPAR